MKLSLRARLLVVPALVVVAAVTLLAVLEHAEQRRWLIARESEALRRTAREAARTAAPALGTLAGAALGANAWQEYADSLDARLALRVTLIARDGAVLADSRAPAASMENHAGREEVAAALRGGVGLKLRRSATLGVEFLYCAVPLARPDAAVLRLAEPMDVLKRLSEALIVRSK